MSGERPAFDSGTNCDWSSPTQHRISQAGPLEIPLDGTSSVNISEIFRNLCIVAPGHCDQDGNLIPRYLKQEIINKLNIAGGFLDLFAISGVPEDKRLYFAKVASRIVKGSLGSNPRMFNALAKRNPGLVDYLDHFLIEEEKS